jgi:SulP family sulfate permease
LPLFNLDAQAVASIYRIWPDLLFYSLVAATVAALETLVAVRLVQNATDREVGIRGELTPLGGANCLVSSIGGLIVSGVPSLTFLNFSTAPERKVRFFFVALTVLLVGVIFSNVLAEIPTAALSAIMIATSLRLVDQWSLGLPRKILRSGSRDARSRLALELLVVVAVMGMTAFQSIVAGMAVGCLLSGIIFIARIGRPIVLRPFWGDEVSSKRIRSNADVDLLQRTGRKRVALELRGVLFFANSDHLGRTVKQLMQDADLVALDFRRVADIDVSAINVLKALSDRAKKLNKKLVLCNIAPSHLEAFNSLGNGPFTEHVLSDLDVALEWMEEQVLLSDERASGAAEPLPLDRVDFVQGLSPDELNILSSEMVKLDFAPETMLCSEGDRGDRMWLLLRGSVSIRVATPSQKGFRIVSLGRGTTVGELSLVGAEFRSGSLL